MVPHRDIPPARRAHGWRTALIAVATVLLAASATTVVVHAATATAR